VSEQDVPDEVFLTLEDDARHAAEVAARSERHQRLQRATEVATWMGTLEDLAERRLPVVVHLAGGRRVRGSLFAVEPDLVALRSEAGQLVVVRAAAVRMLRPQHGVAAAVATGDRQRVTGRRFLEVLQELTEDRARVLLGIGDLDEPVVGRLRAMGEDVVTVALESTPPGLAYLPLAAVQEITVDP
jgi:hypothetical protein